jgi:hypothetical protein
MQNSISPSRRSENQYPFLIFSLFHFIIYTFEASTLMIRFSPKKLRASAFVFSLLFGMASAGSAWADRDVYLANVGGQVGIGSANDTSPAEPDLITRVFSRVMVPGFPPFSPADYGLDEPGYFSLPAGDSEIPPGASALPGNATVTVNLLPFTVNANTSNLFFWNGSGSVNFQPISQPGVTMTIDPNPIGNTGATGGADIHPAYRLDNGGSGIPADGVYLTMGTVSVTGLSDSPRVFFLHLADVLVTDEDDAETITDNLAMGDTLFKGKDFGFFLGAQDYVQNNLVPEPGTLSLAFVMITALGGTVRRRRA